MTVKSEQIKKWLYLLVGLGAITCVSLSEYGSLNVHFIYLGLIAFNTIFMFYSLTKMEEKIVILESKLNYDINPKIRIV